MSQSAIRTPETTRNAIATARALTIGLRAWNLYPPEHPALGLAIDRLVAVTAEATANGPLMLAVTPLTLVVDGAPLSVSDAVVTDCARLLHDLDILQLSLVAAAGQDTIRALLDTLTIDRVLRRARGGPAAIWAETGHAAIIIEQIDYQELLEREADSGPARRDALWQSIVRSIVAGRRTFTEAEQRRLLEISKDAWAIGELADDCRGAYCASDGSPMLTTQAATVLAVYRHLAATVGVLEPERASEVMNNFALATSSIDPALAFEVLQSQDAADESQPIVAALKNTFDEQQIALLLARALAKSGEGTNRISQMLDTLAPDADRRQRVLRMADKLLTERDFGATRPITDIRASLEELLLKYDETPYVSEAYRQSMDAATERAAELAARDLPPELGAWLETLGHENVRALSGQLLIDLLGLETDAARAAEIARDMSVFAQDLVMAGAYQEAHRIVAALRTAARQRASVAAEPTAKAIDLIGRATAMAEAVATLGDLDARDAESFATLCQAIGPSCAPALVTAFAREDGGTQVERSRAILIGLGAPAIPEIASSLDDRKWFVQREIAQTLGAIGTPAAVPPLHSLLRRSDPRVLKTVVTALAGIDDPSAARALHTVLRLASGSARDAVVQSLVALRDPRVVPMLARILDESDVLGKDFELVLQSLDAIATFQDDRAIQPITTVANHRRWLSLGRTRKMRERALGALEDIGTPNAIGAIAVMRDQGDWHLRRVAKSTGSIGGAS